MGHNLEGNEMKHHLKASVVGKMMFLDPRYHLLRRPNFHLHMRQLRHLHMHTSLTHASDSATSLTHASGWGFGVGFRGFGVGS